MTELLNLNHDIHINDFKTKEISLRNDLVETQLELLDSEKFSVIILLLGMDVLGRSATAKRLSSWMDPRHIRPYAMIRPSEEELDRPRMWRFWKALPRKGRIGLFLNAWYERPSRDYLTGDINDDQFQIYIDEILRFERLLSQEGTVVLKYLFTLPKKANINQMKRLKNDRSVAWKVSKDELDIGWKLARNYRRTLRLIDNIMQDTNTAHAPWFPISSLDRNLCDYTIGHKLVNTIRDRLSSETPSAISTKWRSKFPVSGHKILDELDLSKSLKRKKYKRHLKLEQGRLSALVGHKKFEKRALVIVFEGIDAAGKGGTIRRVNQALDPRLTRIIPIAAPTSEEKARPYLWRFWNHIPRKGHVTIFDRSWYGRVLVERVEGFCPDEDWMRAYDEINTFETELSDYGIVVMKFWMDIDKNEQLHRFKERQKTGYKRHKITDEDWRNRDKWDDYAVAIQDMIVRTSSKTAPWTLVEANDKLFARVKVLRTISDRLECEL